MSGSHTVELADTHREAKALSHQALNLTASGKRVALAIIQHKGEHLSPKLRGVAVAPLWECVLTFLLDTTRPAGTRWYDASGQGSASVPV